MANIRTLAEKCLFGPEWPEVISCRGGGATYLFQKAECNCSLLEMMLSFF